MTEPESLAVDLKPLASGHAPARPYNVVGEPLPNAMGCGELMRALNLKPATFYAFQKAGKLKRFEFRRPVGRKKRYSGELVTRYLKNVNT
jgi:hypothetical protein